MVFTLSTHPWSLQTNEEKIILLEVIALFTLVWSFLYIISRFFLFQKKSHDFSNRIVSVAHVVVALWLSMRSVNDWKKPFAGIGGPNSPAQVITIVASISYFIYDFFCCFLEVPIDWIMSVHHIFTILGFSYGIISGHCGTELVSCLWLMELSNPFMHARELIKELGLKDSTIATVNDVVFALTFMFARMIVGPFIVSATLNANSPVGVKLGAVGIQLVSTLWFYKILRVVYYKVLKKGSIQTNGKEKST